MNKPADETDKPAIDGGKPVAQEKDYIRFCPPLIEADDLEAVAGVLRSGWLSTGPKAQEFEAAFMKYTGAENALALNSCTAGLHLSLLAHGIGPGDEVIVPAMTFAATANVVELVGAKPVLADSVQSGFNMDPAHAARRITPRTKAMIPVHFGGLPCEMDAIGALAAEKGLHIIEDCAHALGSAYRGRRIGGSGSLCCFSFYPTKNMTTIEGGMVTGPGADRCFSPACACSPSTECQRTRSSGSQRRARRTTR